MTSDRAPSPSARHRADTHTILRHWREAVPNDRLAHLVKDSTRALVRALSVRLAAHDVNFGHWTFLRILWEGDGLTQRELSDEAGVMEPTTFSALKTMERRGYVKRRRLGVDRKKVYVFLTPKGRALKRKLVPAAEDVNRIAARGVSKADVATARAVLFAMIENLAHDEERAVKHAPARSRVARPKVKAHKQDPRPAPRPNRPVSA